MSTTAPSSLEQFQWTPQPQAEQFLREIVSTFISRFSAAAEMARRMSQETGTRFIDWIETLVLPDSAVIRQKLQEVGYVNYRDRTCRYPRVFAQPQGMFPRVALQDEQATVVHLKVASVWDFAKAWQLPQPIEGGEWSPYRRVCAFEENGVELWATERWGWTGYDVPPDDASRSATAAKLLNEFRSRHREFDDDAEGFAQAMKLIDSSPLNIDFTCTLFFQAEREYWQNRNRAAQVQKARQDKLGLGWGNHDHHTYRSSREQFGRLVSVWERLGFLCRERFYAGREAGWGAQVMEQPYAGIITFNDVDLTPDELMGDFSHESLAAQDHLGTVGLWCALHGEAFLQAGMHHLEAQFDFQGLQNQLGQAGVKMMKPFTNFPYLRQAFTEGERWPVAQKRIDHLLNRGLITKSQADEFSKNGAIGSHLENLERNEGFKGFNQTGVSQIIAATDPRKHSSPGNQPAQIGG